MAEKARIMPNAAGKPPRSDLDGRFKVITYKRNQLEQAIARIFDQPTSELRTRIKRLLELDRALGRKRGSLDPEKANFAFFSHEAPGTGADILFSEYDAFALLNGVRIMEHGWPQGFAVSVMRRLRPDLEPEHFRILNQDPLHLFDRAVPVPKPCPHDILVENTDPVFVTVISTKTRPRGAKTIPVLAVCHGAQKVVEFGRGVGAASLTMWEVVSMAHRFRDWLRQTKP